MALALHHAHDKGVVHRDLKPANVLMTADGCPKIADFGLARHEQGAVHLTLEGTLLGTPAYMSPEQAQGQSHLADRRTDVWALGVMLFEMLTGSRPFAGNSVSQILQAIVNAEPLRPRKLRKRLPRDLETICLKCLEKRPEDRYQTALALAEDLQRHLAHEPILARRAAPLVRAAKWMRRQPAKARGGLLLGLLLWRRQARGGIWMPIAGSTWSTLSA